MQVSPHPRGPAVLVARTRGPVGLNAHPVHEAVCLYFAACRVWAMAVPPHRAVQETAGAHVRLA